jgi:hypothetical protein
MAPVLLLSPLTSSGSRDAMLSHPRGTSSLHGRQRRGDAKRRTRDLEVMVRDFPMCICTSKFVASRRPVVAQSGYLRDGFCGRKSDAIISATSFPAASSRCRQSDRTLTLNTKVLLLDEPTEELAPTIVDELLKAVGTMTRSGGICSIIVEQHAQKILGLAYRVMILERRAIGHDAASAEVRADPAVLERYLGVAGKP